MGDHPAELAFDVQVDDVQQLFLPELAAAPAIAEDRAEIRRGYVTAMVRRQLHQQAFRARVLEAYRTQCALCRLRHQELLDAAHIIGDAEDLAIRSSPTDSRSASFITRPSTGTS